MSDDRGPSGTGLLLAFLAGAAAGAAVALLTTTKTGREVVDRALRTVGDALEKSADR